MHFRVLRRFQPRSPFPATPIAAAQQQRSNDASPTSKSLHRPAAPASTSSDSATFASLSGTQDTQLTWSEQQKGHFNCFQTSSQRLLYFPRRIPARLRRRLLWTSTPRHLIQLDSPSLIATHEQTRVYDLAPLFLRALHHGSGWCPPAQWCSCSR